jgi:hypothetical protein
MTTKVMIVIPKRSGIMNNSLRTMYSSTLSLSHRTFDRIRIVITIAINTFTEIAATLPRRAPSPAEKALLGPSLLNSSKRKAPVNAPTKPPRSGPIRGKSEFPTKMPIMPPKNPPIKPNREAP